MKKAVVALFFIVFLCTHLAAKTTPEITFKIKGTNRAYALLAYYYGDKQYIADSAKVAPDGTVVFKRDSAYATGIYMLVYTKSKDFFDFYIEEDKQVFTIAADGADPLRTAKITGSPGNELFFNYLLFINDKKEEGRVYKGKASTYPDSAKFYQSKLDNISKEVLVYQNNILKKHPKSYLACVINANWTPEVPTAPKGVADTAAYIFYEYRSHYWDKFPFNDPRIVFTPILNAKISEYIEKLTPLVPDSVISSIRFICSKLQPNQRAYRYAVSYCINKYAKDKTVGFDAVYVFMVNEYYASGKAPWVAAETLDKMTARSRVLEPLLLGRVAPALNLPDTANVKHSLLAVNAPFTIVFFWSPDCSHCLEDAPKLLQFYHKAKGKGIEVYAVAGSATQQQWLDAIKTNGLDWINVMDTDNQRQQYDITMFPVVYILDKDKKIVMKRLEVDQIQLFFEKQYGMYF